MYVYSHFGWIASVPSDGNNWPPIWYDLYEDKGNKMYKNTTTKKTKQKKQKTKYNKTKKKTKIFTLIHTFIYIPTEFVGVR